MSQVSKSQLLHSITTLFNDRKSSHLNTVFDFTSTVVTQSNDVLTNACFKQNVTYQLLFGTTLISRKATC